MGEKRFQTSPARAVLLATAKNSQLFLLEELFVERLCEKIHVVPKESYFSRFPFHPNPSCCFYWPSQSRPAHSNQVCKRSPFSSILAENLLLKDSIDKISIPLFSPQNDKIFPVIYFASVGISDPAFGSLSELRYVPTIRTFLF